MVGSIDRVIQTSLKVKCLQEECDWTGCIMDYKVCREHGLVIHQCGEREYSREKNFKLLTILF